jgi:hypothetical protein
VHNEEFHNLYTSPNIVRVIKSMTVRWAGHVAHMGDMRSAYKILIRTPGGSRLLGRRRCRWEDNIRMDLRDTGWEGVDWMHLDQERDQ